ncbi:MAG TPA: CPBP family intramembrane glutamic endopeptidase [Candidatus Saccharimonadales bacterium]|nr:CPBP family intramembrane glutamic endopeptidase [Candidatus Saccharimonadales bacterium]
MLSDSSKPEVATTPKTKTWSPLTAVLIVLASFLLAPAIVQMVLMGIPYLMGWDSFRAEQWLSESPVSSFFYVLLVETLTIGGLYIFTRYKKVSFRKVAALEKFKARDIGHALLGFLIYFGLFAIALTIVDQFVTLDTDQKQALGFSQGVGGLGLALAFVSLVVLPPIAEEIIFRGFLYGTLRKRLGAWSTIIVTSIFFAGLHLFGAEEGGLLWSAFVDVFVLSIVLCYLREQNGSIWASVGVHALKNGFVFLNLFIISAR